MKRNCLLLMVLIFLMALSSCAMGTAKSISEMTPKEKTTFMLGVYNSQYADYMSQTGYSWDGEKKEYVKISTPTLSDERKEVLKKKKEILTKLYPLIKIYDSTVNSGAAPNREVEQQIFDLLNNLQSM
jgi:disulfide oxidoreductase YuzD